MISREHIHRGIGIHRLRGAAKDIELYAKSDNPDHGQLTELVDPFRSTLEAVLLEIRSDFKVSSNPT